MNYSSFNTSTGFVFAACKLWYPDIVIASIITPRPVATNISGEMLTRYLKSLSQFSINAIEMGAP